MVDLADIWRAGDGELHVWRLDVAAAPVRELLPLLDVEERARAAKFVFVRHHDEFVAVRGWLRRLLGAYLDRDPAGLRFLYGTQGKPELAEDVAAMRFNVSHSDGWALLAFGAGVEIGVDVEAVREPDDFRDLAHECFSPAEMEAFSAVEFEHRAEFFYRLWTAKEAYTKALGGGLSIPLREVTIDVRDPAGPWPVLTTDERADAWVVRPVRVCATHAGAVATSGDSRRLLIFDVGDAPVW
ncbi:MAG: 4'-phosphopantetheinyl transferase family protein [Gemmatimonadaceae bacterium]